MEAEYDTEQRRHAETQKNARKADRRLKELAFQCEEDKKNQERLQELIDKLQNKIKTYKRQVEEAVSKQNCVIRFLLLLVFFVFFIISSIFIIMTKQSISVEFCS